MVFMALGTSVLQWSDSGYAFSIGSDGTTGTSATGGKAMIMKTNFSSDSIWCNSYGAIGSGLNSIRRSSADGGIVSAGWMPASKYYSGLIVKTDSTGALSGSNCWTKSFTSAELYSICESKNSSSPGFIFVGGHYEPMAGASPVWRKYSSTGDSVWKGVFIGGSYFYSSISTSDGNYITAGYAYAPASVVKINDTGDTLWSRNYACGRNGIKAIREAADRGFFMIADSSTLTASSYLLRVNSYGDSLWANSLGTLTCTGDNSFQKLANGNFVIVGNTAAAEPSDVRLLILDPTGAIIVNKTYSSLGLANAVQQTNDGGFIITGSKNGQVMLTKIDANGNTGE